MTLRVYHSEPGARDGTSPLAAYGWKGGPDRSETRTYRVRWADRHLALRQLVGYSYVETSEGPDGNAARKLRRELPEGVPWDPTVHCTRARIVRGEKWTGRAVYERDTGQLRAGYPNRNPTKDDDLLPTDGAWKANEFKTAVITADFAAGDFYRYDDAAIDSTFAGSELARFTSYRDDRSASYVTIRGGVLYYIIPEVPADASTRVIPFALGRIEGKKSVFLKWHQVAVDAVPWQTIDGLVGKTNKLPFLNYPAGTLLMLPPKVDRYVMANGWIGCDVELVMDFFKEGHHKILYAAQGKAINYRYATTMQSRNQEPTPGEIPAGEFIYDEADYFPAFNPANP